MIICWMSVAKKQIISGRCPTRGGTLSDGEVVYFHAEQVVLPAGE